MKLFSFLSLAVTLIGCNKSNNIISLLPNENYQCTTSVLKQDLTLNQLTNLFDSIIIQQLATKNAPEIGRAHV